MRGQFVAIVTCVGALAAAAVAQTARQPKVAPGPDEPNWDVVLKEQYGLAIFEDLLNPVKDRAESTPGLFKPAGSGPVKYTPLIALGLPTVTRGGWYRPGKDPAAPTKHELWSYQHRNTGADLLDTGKNLPPPLAAGGRRALSRVTSRSVSGSRTTGSRMAASSPSRRSLPRSINGWRNSRTRP